MSKKTHSEQLMDELVARYLKGQDGDESSLNVTILTGAGVSTDSGLPDFRGRAGLWADAQGLDLLTAQGAIDRFEPFTQFCKEAIAHVQAGKPNPAHQVIAELQRAGIIGHIITQNVDGYHQEAGATKVIEVHGNLRDIGCMSCGTSVSMTVYMAKCGEFCPCGGHRRPRMVLFGEPLPTAAMRASLKVLLSTNLLIVAGSSLAVTPTSIAPRLVLANGGEVAVFNQAPVDAIMRPAYSFHMPMSEIVGLLCRSLLKHDQCPRGLRAIADLWNEH